MKSNWKGKVDWKLFMGFFNKIRSDLSDGHVKSNWKRKVDSQLLVDKLFMKKFKCPSCAEEWYIENNSINRMNFCPFCAEEIRKKAVLEEMDSLGKAIYKVVSDYGVDILSNSRRLIGIMNDLAHDLEKEVRIFSKAFNEEYLLIYKKAFSKDISEAEKDLSKIRHFLIENDGLSESWAEKLFQNCLSAIMYVKGEGLPDVILAETTDVTLIPELVGADVPSAPMTPQTPVVATVKSENRLMKDACDVNATVLGSSYTRSSIYSITFLGTLEDMPRDAWDASEDGSGSVMAWVSISQHKNLYDLFIAANGEIKVSNCHKLFEYYENLKKIEFNGIFNTSRVKAMSRMFYGCASLEELNLSGLDTSKVTNMGYMFYGCRALKKLDLGGFDTSQVTDMEYMFWGCSSLAKLDLSGFDTSQVKYMPYMFADCAILKELDLSSFDISHVANMKGMFRYCSALNVRKQTDFLSHGRIEFK